jgi:polygalacturonase
MRRILIENVTSSNATILPSVIAGLAERRIEDVRIADVFLQHVGGAPAATANLNPPEAELGYPEATMFGDLPATGLFVRHAQGFELSHSEIAVVAPDPRPAIALDDVHGADFIDVRTPHGAPAFKLTGVSDFRSAMMPGRPDRTIHGPATATF